jgi:hypothetical protein
MTSADIDRDQHQTATQREQAAEHRRQAERLCQAGYRDQAARHLLEARLHELRAAALAATSRAA